MAYVKPSTKQVIHNPTGNTLETDLEAIRQNEILTGRVVTPATNDNSTNIANTTWTKARLADLKPNESTSADKLKTSRKIQISGAVEGEANFDGSTDVNVLVTLGNVSVTAEQANKLSTARAITLTGGATGTVSFDGSADVDLDVSLPLTPTSIQPTDTVPEAINWLADSTVDFASAVEPTFTFPFMKWADLSVSPPVVRRRNAGNTAWDGNFRIKSAPSIDADDLITQAQVFGLFSTMSGSTKAIGGGPYLNDTGKPYLIAVEQTASAAGHVLYIRVNDRYVAMHYALAGGNIMAVSAIVPANTEVFIGTNTAVTYLISEWH